MISLQRVLASVYVVALTALLLVWSHQQSLEAYWQQRYHRAPPWEALEQVAVWQAGSRVHQAVQRAAGVFWQELTEREPQLELEQGEVVVEAVAQSQGDAGAVLNAEPVPALQPKQHAEPVPAAAAVAVIDSPAPQPPQSAPRAEDAATAAEPVAQHSAAPQPQPAKRRIRLAPGQRVLFAGDSMMQGVAPHLASRLRREYGLFSLDLSRQSTGLAYPKAFNWPLTIEQQLERNADFSLLAVFLGPNDPWDMPSGRGGKYLRFATPEWEVAYRERIRGIIDSAQRRGVEIIWVAPPSMRRAELSRKVDYLSGLYESEVLAAGELFIAGNQILGYLDGAYSDYSGVTGQTLKMRAGDGIHFTLAGQRAFADALFDLIDYVPQHTAEHDSPDRLAPHRL